MTITSTLRTITPELAEQILEKNLINRRISPKRLSVLTQEMLAGTFKTNGESIIISQSGNLLDGQHRLAAIVQSEKPQEIILVQGVDDTTTHTIDTGRSRSSSDTLNMRGVKSAGTVSASATQLYKVIAQTPRSVPIPTAYILETIERYPSVVRWAQRYNSSKIMKKKIPGSSLIPALVYFDEIAKRPDLANELWNKLETGADMKMGDPVLALSNRLLGLQRNTGGKIWGAVCRVIDAMEKGESLQRIFASAQGGYQDQPALMEQHLSDRGAKASFDDMRLSGCNVRDKKLAERVQPSYYTTVQPVARGTRQKAAKAA